MRRIFFCISIVLLSIKILAQEQSRFPIKQGSSWRINYEYAFSEEPGHAPGDEVYKYFTEGDTIIQGKIFFKVYKSGYLFLETPLRIEKKYMGALRDSANKYYFVEQGNEKEELLYDFDRNVGQNISDGFWGDYTIDAIDTLLDGRRRFQFFIITAHCGSADAVVEGIGWLGGLLEGNSCYSHPGIRGSYAVCYSENGETLFMSEIAKNNGIEDCLEISNPVMDQPGSQVRFRQSSRQLWIDVPADQLILSIEVGDLLGRIIWKEVFSSESQVKISLSSFPAGQYYLRVKTNQSLFTTGFIKLNE